MLAQMMRYRTNVDGNYETRTCGLEVLRSPLWNQGTALTAEERTATVIRGNEIAP